MKNNGGLSGNTTHNPVKMNDFVLGNTKNSNIV